MLPKLNSYKALNRMTPKMNQIIHLLLDITYSQTVEEYSTRWNEKEHSCSHGV